MVEERKGNTLTYLLAITVMIHCLCSLRRFRDAVTYCQIKIIFRSPPVFHSFDRDDLA